MQNVGSLLTQILLILVFVVFIETCQFLYSPFLVHIRYLILYKKHLIAAYYSLG